MNTIGLCANNISVEQKPILTKGLFSVASSLSPSYTRPNQHFIKRIFDLTAALAGIITISPILLTTAIAIKLESKGPVLFKQRRKGQYGKEFYIYKFRSMSNDAEKEQEKLRELHKVDRLNFKIDNDPRITNIGKFIRKYSIDELPQLFNVITGEMSLVGFRPPLIDDVECYEDRHFVRFSMLPGLTGPWQVNGRSNIKNFDDVIRLEYNYLKNWSIIEDFKILFKTIPVVLFGKGAV